MSNLQMLEAFLADKNAWEMFLLGRAGTGKTTELGVFVQYLIDKEVKYVICAKTHKACEVLRGKLPDGANVQTLDSYLKKRPCINEHATKEQHVDVRSRNGLSERYELVGIDEYSMVGESDYVDLQELQDPHDGMDNHIKTLYIGDPYQLPPVGDLQTINPKGPYLIELTKVHRTDRPDLLNAMTHIVDMIKGAPAEAIRSSENVLRGQDIVKMFSESTTSTKVCLAWTNKAVERLNSQIAGKTVPEIGDVLWCPALRAMVTLEWIVPAEEVRQIETVMGTLVENTKWKTLEHLKTLPGIQFYKVYNHETKETQILAGRFGHYSFKSQAQALSSIAVEINAEIKSVHSTTDVVAWVRKHGKTALAKERGRAWRNLLTYKNAVVCLDFPHAQTIHTSQGSTYEEVYLDSEDLYLCSTKNMLVYLKLWYVALSRTSKLFVTN